MMTVPAHDGHVYAISTHSPSAKHRQQRSPTTSPRLSTTRTKLHHRLSSPPPSEIVSSAKMIQRSSRRVSTSGSDIFDESSPAVSKDRAIPNGVPVSQNHLNGHASANGAVDKKIFKRQKIDWEIPRKVLHSSIGFLVIPLYTSHTAPRSVVYTLSAALAGIVTADVIRLRSTRFERLYERMLGFLMRDVEKHQTNGVVWYILGCIIVLSSYRADIAVVSILILSWCDTTASFIGRLYGAYTPPLPQSLRIPLTTRTIPLPLARRKSLAGFIAAAVTGCLIGITFWGWIAPMGAETPSWTWPSSDGWMGYLGLAAVGIVTGLISSVAESLDVGSLDDNLTLPVIAGGLLTLFLRR